MPPPPTRSPRPPTIKWPKQSANILRRFTALAAAAPQDPKAAVKEIERAIHKLGMKGVIINSHTRGEFLDDPKFWEIFEAVEALKVPIYLHPQTPPPAMIGPYVERGP